MDQVKQMPTIKPNKAPAYSVVNPPSFLLLLKICLSGNLQKLWLTRYSNIQLQKLGNAQVNAFGLVCIRGHANPRMEFQSVLELGILAFGLYQHSRIIFFPVGPPAPARKASKVLASQYWRPKIRGRLVKLKLKIYLPNRPCRFQKQLWICSKPSNKNFLLVKSMYFFSREKFLEYY